MPGYARAALTLLRVAVALLLVVHGVARIALGIVDDFGVALGQWGFPLGHVIAWTITLVEVVGGVALASGWFVRPLSVWFILQLIAGISLVHARDGWLVVGAGRNGVEYSVLLIICLAVIALADPGAYRVGRARQLI
jgi:putative oxidoreductase